jgi:23S rRNA U2552 (ribose-2'-O)-methylase RlmE/FtsJ
MHLYKKIVKQKYKLSEKYFSVKLDINNTIEYKYYYDLMNTYTILPTLLSFDIKFDENNNININDLTKYNGIIDAPNISNFSQKLLKLYTEKIQHIRKYTSVDKINNIEKLFKDYSKKHGKNINVRRLFSYEIIDELLLNYNAENVTTAWLKCYEILEYYKICTNTSNDVILYFGICEHPGAFVFAINHYIKQKLSKKFDFVLQSLNNKFTSSAFKPDKYLYEKYSKKYDYGPNITGDIMDVDNIRYYRKKYINYDFHIITSDCGIACTSDSYNQESNYLDLLFGEIILAISLSSIGTTYILKLFTIYENVLQQFIFLLSQLYEKVHIARTLTTKLLSGEIYCVCEYFKYKKSDTNKLCDDLCEWYLKYKNDNKLQLINNLSKDNVFVSNIGMINKYLLYRLLTNYNFTYFKLENIELTYSNYLIPEYVSNLANHYANYFIKVNNIVKLSDEHKLVSHKYKSHYLKREYVSINNNVLYKNIIYPRDLVMYNDSFMGLIYRNNIIFDYKYTKLKLDIQISNLSTDKYEHISKKNSNIFTIVLSKSKHMLERFANVHLSIYKDINITFLLMLLVKYCKKYNKNIKKIYHYDYIFRNRNTTILEKETNDKIYNYCRVIYKYIPKDDFNFDIIYNSNMIYYFSALYPPKYALNGIHPFNYLLQVLCDIIVNMKTQCALILFTTTRLRINYDIINFISKYFEYIHIHDYKYYCSAGTYITFINRNDVKMDPKEYKLIKQKCMSSYIIKTLYNVYDYNLEYNNFLNNYYEKYIEIQQFYLSCMQMYIDNNKIVHDIIDKLKIHKLFVSKLYNEQKYKELIDM